MVCPITVYNSVESANSLLNSLKNRLSSSSDLEEPDILVKKILNDVINTGIDAVIKYTRQFDCPSFTEANFRVSLKDLKKSLDSLDHKDREILESAIDNIRSFHECQKEKSWFLNKEDGSFLGQRVLPVSRAGLYVPGGKGGTTPLVSSLLMNAIPALVAGVKEIAITSPPNLDGGISPIILASACLLGIEEVYACGGAWGIGALAYGAGSLRPVDVITGPGNKYVATAKKLLIGTVGIDMLAGPSEILIVADDGANPKWVAADMLSQAEHDADAASICLCFKEETANLIHKELSTQLELLPRKDIAKKSLLNNGCIGVVSSYELAAKISNCIAPEHLELLVKEPFEIVNWFTNAGAIFMGYNSAEPFGDYYAGPNHVLPTMTTSRFSSALGVSTFYKRSSIVGTSQNFAKKSADAVARLARLEGLEGHARSALCRKEQ